MHFAVAAVVVLTLCAAAAADVAPHKPPAAAAPQPPADTPASPASATPQVHAFVYLWYGNPDTDGRYLHWDHSVLPHWREEVRKKYPKDVSFPACDEIHAPFFPRRGCYSSADGDTLRAQFTELAEAGVDTAVVSWWGQPTHPGTHDTQGISTDARIPAVLDAALAAGVFVAFHMEPYHGRTAATLRADVRYIHTKYGRHLALLRRTPRRTRAGEPPPSPQPVFYVYDSYHIPPQEWLQVLSPTYAGSVRGVPNSDGYFIGLWLRSSSGRDVVTAGFDAAYTYFASTGFSYGSTPSNWPHMARFLEGHGMDFIPSTGPGYDDSKIRPWNTAATRDRGDGQYYRDMWDAALGVQPAIVSITSYNEWGEGTQIEPAVPYVVPRGRGLSTQTRTALGISATASDYGDGGPNLYLNITATYSRRLREERQRSTPPVHEEL